VSRKDVLPAVNDRGPHPHVVAGDQDQGLTLGKQVLAPALSLGVGVNRSKFGGVKSKLPYHAGNVPAYMAMLLPGQLGYLPRRHGQRGVEWDKCAGVGLNNCRVIQMPGQMDTELPQCAALSGL